MITASDSFNTVDLGKYFAILPSAGAYTVESYCEEHGGKPVPQGYAFNSGTNPDFLTMSELKKLVSLHVEGPLADNSINGD